MAKQIDDRTQELFNRARIALDKKDHNYAVELLNQALAVRQDFAEARQLLHRIKRQRWESGSSSPLRRVIASLIGMFPLSIALIQEMKSDPHAAIDAYEKLLQAYPLSPTGLIKIGVLLRKTAAKEAAVAVLEEAFGVAPKNTVLLENLGELYSETGNYGKARFCFKSLLKIKPHDAAAERGLKNIDALGTIEKSFKKEDYEGNNFRVREIE